MSTTKRQKGKVTAGTYFRLSERANRLRIFITAEGREYLRDSRTGERDKSGRYLYEENDKEMLWQMMEEFWEGSWSDVPPAAVGDMRDDAWLVITNDYTYADPEADDVMLVGVAYSFDRYWIDSYLQDLLQKGYVDWKKHVYLSPDELDRAILLTRPDNSERAREGYIEKYRLVTPDGDRWFPYTIDGRDDLYAARSAFGKNAVLDVYLHRWPSQKDHDGGFNETIDQLVVGEKVAVAV